MKPPVTPATVFLSSSEYQCQADPNRAFFAKHSFPKIFSGPQPHVDSQMLPRNVHVPLVSFLPVSRFCTLPLQPPPDSPVFTTSCPVDHAEAVKEELPETPALGRLQPTLLRAGLLPSHLSEVRVSSFPASSLYLWLSPIPFASLGP